MPETYFVRQARGIDGLPDSGSAKPEHDHKEEASVSSRNGTDMSSMGIWDQLNIPLKSLSSDFSLKVLFRPWAMVLTPNIFWALLA